jgi:hypothetical protein
MNNKVSYCDFNSVLVVNIEGKLRQVFTPFRVIAKDSRGETKQVFIVQEVRSTEKDELVYIINDKHFFHHHFEIEIRF